MFLFFKLIPGHQLDRHLFLSFCIIGILSIAQSVFKKLMVTLVVGAMYIVGLYYFDDLLKFLDKSIFVIAHIIIFTTLFALKGALTNKSMKDLIPFLLIYVCIGIFFILDSLTFSSAVSVKQGNIILMYLGLDNKGNASLIYSRVMALTFTYHYFNWFIKVKIIKWHLVQRKWLILLLASYAIYIFLYFTSLPIAREIAVTLSIAHVLWEFPLNIYIIKENVRLVFSHD